MSAETGGHLTRAVAALAEREYESAGDEYTRAAWRVLAEPREGLSPFADDENGWVGEGLQWLVAATVAYRVAGRDTRATRRGVEGVAVARDLATTRDHPVQRACLAEVVADFRAAAGMDDVNDAYREAGDAYEACGDAVDSPQRWATTPLFQAAAGIIKQVSRGFADGEVAVAWDDLHGRDPSEPGEFLAARATYKRQRFPALVERAIEERVLAAPRGTTEYGNAAYRCPGCGATDVNWIADNVLCLRCSAPMEPQ